MDVVPVPSPGDRRSRLSASAGTRPSGWWFLWFAVALVANETTLAPGSPTGGRQVASDERSGISAEGFGGRWEFLVHVRPGAVAVAGSGGVRTTRDSLRVAHL